MTHSFTDVLNSALKSDRRVRLHFERKFNETLVERDDYDLVDVQTHLTMKILRNTMDEVTAIATSKEFDCDAFEKIWEAPPGEYVFVLNRDDFLKAKEKDLFARLDAAWKQRNEPT